MLKRLTDGLKKFIDDERGSFAFFVIFAISLTLLLLLFAIGIPLGLTAISQFFKVGDDLITDSSQTFSTIQNETIKQQVTNALNSAQQSTADQVSILSWFVQYAWIWILLVVTLVVYMLGRRTVEYGGGLR